MSGPFGRNGEGATVAVPEPEPEPVATMAPEPEPPAQPEPAPQPVVRAHPGNGFWSGMTVAAVVIAGGSALLTVAAIVGAAI